MDLNHILQTTKPYAVPIALALVTGRALRRLLLLPLEWLTQKTSNTLDDVLLNEAESDLGIDGRTLDKAKDNVTDPKK